jgi:hypothetical protein
LPPKILEGWPARFPGAPSPEGAAEKRYYLRNSHQFSRGIILKWNLLFPRTMAGIWRRKICPFFAY